MDFIFFSTLFFLILASYFDLKTGEIPYWISFPFIYSGLFLSLYHGNINNLQYAMFINAVIGGIIFLVFGLIAYKFAFLGGGDVMLFAGAGAGIANMGGIPLNENPYISFIFDLGIASIIWGLIYASFTAIKNKKILAEFKEKMRFPFILLIILNFVIVLLLMLKIRSEILLILIIEIFFLIMTLLKIVEKHMIEEIPTENLNEEDTIYEDLIIKGKNLKNKFLSKEEVEEIRKIKETVKIKRGIKYAPAILLAFIIFYLYGNVLFYLINFTVFF